MADKLVDRGCARLDGACDCEVGFCRRHDGGESLRRTGRVNSARTALAALRGDEWSEVMQHFCHACGGAPDCRCWDDS